MSSNLKLVDILLILLILSFSLAIFGLQPLEGNNTLYYPYLLKLKNPSLFPNDILFESFKYHLSLFYELAIFVSNFFHISISALLTYLCWIVFFLIAILSFLIAQLLFRNKIISFLFLLFLMGAKYSLAYEAIGLNLSQVTQTTITTAIALLTLFLFLRNNDRLAFFILGLMANIQPIITFQLMLVLSFSQLIKVSQAAKKIKIIKRIIIQYFFVLLGSLPIIISVFILKNRSVLSANWFSYAPEWFEIVKLRISHHFLPSRWGFLCWFLGASFLGLFLATIYLKKQRQALTNKDKTIINIMLGFIPVFFLGSIGEIIPVPLILLTEIFRAFVFFDFFCILYASYLVYNLLRVKSFPKKLIGLILGYWLFLPTSTIFNFNPFKPIIIGSLSLLMIFTFLAWLRQKNIIKKILLKKLVFIIFFSFFSLAAGRRLYLNYKYWGYFTFDNSKNKEWQDVQLWAKAHTSPATIFLVPPNIYGFRVYSERSIVADFKGGASLLFHPYLYKEWAQRMSDLGVKKEMAKGAFLFGYKEIRDEIAIKDLAEKYKADYLVSSYNDLNLPKVYNNKEFAVYSSLAEKSD